MITMITKNKQLQYFNSKSRII